MSILREIISLDKFVLSVLKPNPSSLIRFTSQNEYKIGQFSFSRKEKRIANGATIIEKPITHDRDKKGLDFESALNASEFKKFTSMIHILDESRGKGIFRDFIKSEIEYRKFQKKTIVAKHNICKGEKLSKRDFLFLRAKKLVFQPNEVGKLVNKRVKRNIKKFQVIEKKDFTWKEEY